MLVKTVLLPSEIEGVGLFAAEPIQRGAKIWDLNRQIDVVFDGDLTSLPPSLRDHFERYAYLNFRSGEYILCGDNGKFFNHAEQPNTAEIYPDGDIYGYDIAARDIKVGEELTTNYRGFDGEWSVKIVRAADA